MTLGKKTLFFTLRIERAMENFAQDHRTVTPPPPPKLKVFWSVQKNLATFGVTPELSLQPYPFNSKIFTNFLVLISSIICSLVFEFFEAKTFTELEQSIYLCSLDVLIIFALPIFIFNVEKLFKHINDCEDLVNTSEYSVSSLASIPVFCPFLTLFYFRSSVEIFSVAIDFQWICSTWTKINGPHILHYGESYANNYYCALGHLRLFCLFHDRCGKYGFWVTNSNVVSIIYNVNHNACSKAFLIRFEGFRSIGKTRWDSWLLSQCSTQCSRMT